jgi:predicted  nucleic acid-binding Zn-ribbon protein
MSEDLTRDMPERSFQERVLAEFAAMRGEMTAVRADIAALDRRLTAVEDRLAGVEGRLTNVESRLTGVENRMTTLGEKVDRRLEETRPIWEAVQEQLRKLDTKFDIVIKELYEVRADHVLLAKRVERLEDTPSR